MVLSGQIDSAVLTSPQRLAPLSRPDRPRQEQIDLNVKRRKEHRLQKLGWNPTSRELDVLYSGTTCADLRTSHSSLSTSTFLVVKTISQQVITGFETSIPLTLLKRKYRRDLVEIRSNSINQKFYEHFKRLKYVRSLNTLRNRFFLLQENS